MLSEITSFDSTLFVSSPCARAHGPDSRPKTGQGEGGRGVWGWGSPEAGQESGRGGSQSQARLRTGVGTNSGMRMYWAHVLIFKKPKVGKKRESLSS